MVPRNNAPHRYMGSFYMSKRRKKLEEIQKKNIKMDYFLRNYLLLNLEEHYKSFDLADVNDKMNNFEAFLENSNIKYKTHAHFLKWCNDLKTLSKDLEEKNKNGDYIHMITTITNNYHIVLKENLQKQASIYEQYRNLKLKLEHSKVKLNLLKKEIKNVNFCLKKNKVIKNNTEGENLLDHLRLLNDELNCLLLEKNTLNVKLSLLENDLFAIQSYISLIQNNLKGFESRLYIINNQDIIHNIINKVIPICYDEISISDIRNGLVIIVTDKEKHKQAYVNPFRIDELNHLYFNMLGEDARFLTSDSEKKYTLIRKEDYND